MKDVQVITKQIVNYQVLSVDRRFGTFPLKLSEEVKRTTWKKEEFGSGEWANEWDPDGLVEKIIFRLIFQHYNLIQTT